MPKRVNQPTAKPDAKVEATPQPSRRDELPPLPDRRLSHSSNVQLNTCPRLWYYSNAGAWHGWSSDAPEAVRRAYIAKNRSGAYAFAGNLFHDWSAMVHYSDIDQRFSDKTGCKPWTDEQWANAIRTRFEQRWEQSRTWTYEDFERAPRKRELTWLQEHATGKFPTGNGRKEREAEQAEKKKIWAWLEPSVNNFLAHRGRYMNDVPCEHWKIIEGRTLKDGIAIDDPGKSRRSQRDIRKNSPYPGAQLEVDGYQWIFGYTIDRLIWDPELRRYFFIDWKTGAPKKNDVDQVARYAALAMRDLPDVTTDNVTIRLVYPKKAADLQIEDYELESDEADELVESAREAIRGLMSYMRPIQDVTPEQLGAILPYNLVFNDAGHYRKSNFPEDGLVCLPENFPPTAANTDRVSDCEKCDMRECCPEGQQLVELQW